MSQDKVYDLAASAVVGWAFVFVVIAAAGLGWFILAALTGNL